MGEFYAEYDEGSGMWCVFHTETDGFCYETHTNEESAEAAVEYGSRELLNTD